MKSAVGRLAGKSGCIALGMLVIALLLFPGSPSVLCISPGNHVAIEDVNALCCASFAFSSESGSRLVDGFEKTCGCNNCTDLFLGTNESGALLKSGKFTTRVQMDAACLGTCLSADGPSAPLQAPKMWSADLPNPASAPLRC
jgi:hypothetical protein